jgi:hypothetical protein
MTGHDANDQRKRRLDRRPLPDGHDGVRNGTLSETVRRRRRFAPRDLAVLFGLGAAAGKSIWNRWSGQRAQRLMSGCGEPLLCGGVRRNLVTLSESLEVEQLPSGHDKVANGHANGGPAVGLHDDLEQQARRVIRLGYQDVGHEATHDGAGQLLAGIDRDDPAQLPSASLGKSFADAGQCGLPSPPAQPIGSSWPYTVLYCASYTR